MLIDIVWLLPAAAVALLTVITFLLGVEAGKDRQRRLQRARDRHPAGRDRTYRTNVINITRTSK